jgi:hypothetical protein
MVGPRFSAKCRFANPAAKRFLSGDEDNAVIQAKDRIDRALIS